MLVIFTVGGYVGYLFITYDRIQDNMPLAIEDGAKIKKVPAYTLLTIATQNIGFGAYSEDYTFFMDGGKESRARSEEAVLENTKGVTGQIKKLDADFLLFQEVDLDATRSFHIDQYALLRQDFSEFDSVKSISYDSSYIFYPVTSPHGKSLSSIVTFSKYDLDSSLRRSLPVATGVAKFFDLDRCYSISTLPVDNGKTLHLYNVHLSAYGGSQEIRDGQINMLVEDMKQDVENGDYVICGGDFNHDFTGDSINRLNEGNFDFGWAKPFPEEKLPDAISICKNYTNAEMIPTTRNTDIPYEKGISFVVVIDGFLVSSNIETIELFNVDNGFEFTDHNPVQMKFILK